MLRFRGKVVVPRVDTKKVLEATGIFRQKLGTWLPGIAAKTPRQYGVPMCWFSTRGLVSSSGTSFRL